MPVSSMTTLAQRVRRVSVTIPGSAGTAVTLLSLVLSSLTPADKHNVLGGKVNACAADYTAGDSTTSLPLTVGAGFTYTEPASDFLKSTYVKASAAGTITATISIWLSGDGNTPF